jgi:hypothetical protein
MVRIIKRKVLRTILSVNHHLCKVETVLKKEWFFINRSSKIMNKLSNKNSNR